MILPYDVFKRELDRKIRLGPDFVFDVLVSMIRYPNRYTGLFRVSNAKTKLIQNATQSREIKFGDFIEDIVTMYIGLMGYQNLNKDIGTDEGGNTLSADQCFTDGLANVYLIEQKIRDDHDSTKKRGQYENFRKKFTLLERKYPNYQVVACMWFIDSSLVKNRRYYLSEAEADSTSSASKHILYGKELFTQIFSREDTWDELVAHLERNKIERSTDLLSIPDPDTSPEMLEAMRRLKVEQPGLMRKLLSDAEVYKLLRSELFPTGHNLNQLR